MLDNDKVIDDGVADSGVVVEDIDSLRQANNRVLDAMIIELIYLVNNIVPLRIGAWNTMQMRTGW